MLEPNPAAAVNERLEVLVVVVQLVLGAKQRLDQLRVGDFGADLEVLDVVEAADPAGDVRRRQRLAVERGHDADHVLVAFGRDHRDAKLLGSQAERLRRQRAGGHDGAVDGQAVSLGRGDHQERHRVDRNQAARRQYRSLHALLAAVLEKLAKVGEVAEFRPVDGRLGSGRQPLADLRDHHADLARRHLHPRVFGHQVPRPELEPDARHEQSRLIAGLAVEGDGGVGGVVPARDPLDDQAHLRRSDHDHRPGHDQERHYRDHDRNELAEYDPKRIHLSASLGASPRPLNDRFEEAID